MSEARSRRKWMCWMEKTSKLFMCSSVVEGYPSGFQNSENTNESSRTEGGRHTNNQRLSGANFLSHVDLVPWRTFGEDSHVWNAVSDSDEGTRGGGKGAGCGLAGKECGTAECEHCCGF